MFPHLKSVWAWSVQKNMGRDLYMSVMCWEGAVGGAGMAPPLFSRNAVQ